MGHWAVGIEQNDGRLLLAAVRRRGRTIEWIDQLEVPAYGGDRTQLRAWMRRYERALWVVGLECGQLLVRPLELKLKRRRDVETAFPLQLEALLPCALDQLIVEKQIGRAQNDATPVTALAVPRTSVAQLRLQMENLLGSGWQPDRIGCEPVGLIELCRWSGQETESLLILRCTGDGSRLVLVHEGLIRAVHPIPDGDCSSICLEVNRFQQACAQRWRLPIPEQLLLLCSDPELRQELSQRLQVTELQNVPDEAALFAGALGLGLSGLQSTCDFGQGEFAHSKPWARLRKPIQQLVLAATCLLATATGLGMATIHHKAKQVESGYVALMERAQLPGLMAKPLAPPSSLSLQQYEQRIGLMDSALNSQSEAYPLLPNVPQVRELVAWLGQQPELGGASPTVRLEKLHYALVQRPDAAHPQAPYRVKVDLEMASDNATAARVLHDRLQGSDSLVDPRTALTWNYAKGKYTASFYLKNRGSP